jgi:hypothetical protein
VGCGGSEITAATEIETDADADADADADTDTDTDPDVEVDPTTLNHKMIMGYQGWFSTPDDGSARSGFRHWFSGDTPTPPHVTFDAWPDLSELAPSELHDTELTYADGSPAQLYSAYNADTVARHFLWMEENRIDGVFLQHFVVELERGSTNREFRDQVTANVQAGAETHGRIFAFMYDLSGASNEIIFDRIVDHWEAMVDAGVVHSERYLNHRDRPLVALWGLGFSGRDLTPDIAAALIDYFRTAENPEYRATVMGGVPTYWRTRTADASSDPAWTDLIRDLDVISPWTVGRFADDAGVENYRVTLEADLAAASAAGADLLPVVWPGFSWANLYKGQPLNQIPRRGGRFLWKQVYEYVDGGATMLYGSMFDEVDEATAFFKIAPSRDSTPDNAHFLTLDADGEDLPSDFYLQLAGAARDTLVGDLPLRAVRPLGSAALPTCDPPDTMREDDRCVPSCAYAGGDSCDESICGDRFRFSAHDCEFCCDSSM